ncbi:MAG: hypothetical protein KGI68_10730 [Alphaproteobacteria bacterium]|nr:hypothetical protein [Alphaproteobacteria bacterium]MDE1988015.1 hypothetical protein [Alphaproteobacteria bacterium]MDE2164101.1 hypothetical protein [Alphaproteobacteria bacterium]MDE2501173.1 hypothetical protein [Alphaproteobacteria bacterium]
MRISKRALLSGLAMLGTVALTAAADDTTPMLVNNPADFWGIWGPAKTEMVTDRSVPGGTAKRVAISPKPDHPWDVGAYVGIVKPVHKGDVLLLAFWARAEKVPAGNDFIELFAARIYGTAPPNTGVTPEVSFLAGPQWKQYYESGTATQDYPVGTLSVGMQLGTGDQIVDFGPVSVFDYGPGYDLTKLPHN